MRARSHTCLATARYPVVQTQRSFYIRGFGRATQPATSRIRIVMSTLFAFLHHLAAFALVSALVVEFVLVKDTPTASTARKILLADLIFGLSAGAVLVIGLLRVFYFEKGAAYYFTNIPFLAKLGLFFAIGILSIYPTKTFMSWRPDLKAGRTPILDPGRMKTVRTTIHWEMAATTLLVLCAALMARGVGSL
jgi:putative membrane protein